MAARDRTIAAPDGKIAQSANHSISNQSPIIDPKIAGIYLHIPFCRAICSYCNFNRGLLDDALKTRYVSALEAEIRSAPAGPPADTVFFGGGTPSLLAPEEVHRLIGACRDTLCLAADAEITLETNPDTVTRDRLAAFRDAGVTRISFGVQSFEDDELARLERVHSADRAREAVRAARQAGIENLSLDLMFWLPGQSRASWLRSVGEAIALAPDHLSLYLLELYPNAPLREAMARRDGDGLAAAPWRQAPDDEAADMYLDALEALDRAGFEQYEISNVARPGFSCRHNVKYWQGGEWFGFGCGAHSTVDGVRWHNVPGTADYVARIQDGRPVDLGRCRLSDDERLSEALFMGLRLAEGIDGRNVLARFGVEPWSRYGAELQPYVDEGFAWRRGAAFGLTRRGMLLANELMATFV
jgi:oxygen-independent coproporphyrinogen-3 oxidase